MARVVRTPDVARHNWRFSANDLSGWSNMARYDLTDNVIRSERAAKILALRQQMANHSLDPEVLDFGASILRNK